MPILDIKSNGTIKVSTMDTLALLDINFNKKSGLKANSDGLGVNILPNLFNSIVVDESGLHSSPLLMDERAALISHIEGDNAITVKESSHTIPHENGEIICGQTASFALKIKDDETNTLKIDEDGIYAEAPKYIELYSESAESTPAKVRIWVGETVPETREVDVLYFGRANK